ncbi:PepSY domain-containing protein [Enterobacter mori]|nr:PepSY domain-containing protein [Enterobacter mori]
MASFNTVSLAILTRLHLYIGIFIAPFIFLAALSGTLYVLSPTLEKIMYADLLYPESQGNNTLLSEQIAVAMRIIEPNTPISAVRPAARVGESTRVIFASPDSPAGEKNTVFVDPVALKVLGVLPTYGTSGALPLRTWIDKLHSGALFGEAGRTYSELAASWMWVAAVGGIAMWGHQRRRKTSTSSAQHIRRRWHIIIGWCAFPLMLFISATGLTWSGGAGDNITLLRNALSWNTPQLTTTLNSSEADEEHCHHHCHHDMTGDHTTTSLWRYDAVLGHARNTGITADKVEIIPGDGLKRAWSISEIDRSWPTQVDAIAIDENRMQVVDKIEFAHFSFVAKLIRWGVDAHMGILFGLPNQLILAVFGAGLCLMIIFGYQMWLLRYPVNKRLPGKGTLTASFLLLSNRGKLLWLSIFIPVSLFLPLTGGGVAFFLALDVLLWRCRHRI